MTLNTVTVSGSSAVEVYSTLATVDDYLNASVGPGPSTWRALVTASNDDDRKRTLVAVTRWFDATAWQGAPATPAVGGTTLQWPRSGIATVDPAVVPDAVLRGFAEACGLVAADPSLLSALDSGSNVRALGAGSARIEFFRPTSVQDGNATTLPAVLDRLIGRFLATADPAIAAASAGTAGGVSTCSDFERCDEDSLVRPL